jgi:hypothetical protein
MACAHLLQSLLQYMLQKLELAQINCRLTDGGGAEIGIRNLELDPEVSSHHLLTSAPRSHVSSGTGFRAISGALIWPAIANRAAAENHLPRATELVF